MNADFWVVTGTAAFLKFSLEPDRLETAHRLPFRFRPVRTSELTDQAPCSVGVCSGSPILLDNSAIGVEDVCCDRPLAVFVPPDHDVLTNVLRGAVGGSERPQIGPLIENHVATSRNRYFIGFEGQPESRYLHKPAPSFLKRRLTLFQMF